MASKAKFDRPFLVITIILIAVGFLIFTSASLGLLARGSSNFSSVAFSQTVLGLCLGTVALVVVSQLDYKLWRKSAFYLMAVAIILNILVLIPSIGFEHGGARRWFSLGGFSFQPAELLKIAFVVYFAAWASSVKDKMSTFKLGFMPLFILYAITGALLLAQPDTDNYMLIIFAGVAMFISAKGKWRYLLVLFIAGALGIVLLALTRPYIKQRIETYFNPSSNGQSSGYQIQQSLIAIGSGGMFGRGFGQSVQKFNFLPEPVGDSIFAVASEETGFVGSVFLVLLFSFFATRGLKIASRVGDTFGRLLVVGIVIMIVAQAFVNISAMLGIIPLSGITLPFVSHGGTSLFFTLMGAGIILSVSKHQKLR